MGAEDTGIYEWRIMVDPAIALIIALAILGLGFLLFRPERGMVSRWRRSLQSNERVRREDALKHIHRCEVYARQATLESLAGALTLSVNEVAPLVESLQLAELVTQKNGSIQLTPTGRESALHILRAHRLWERYLADQTGYTQMEWHDQAERLEHLLSPDQTDDLAAQLGFPTHDPHGDPIPGIDGDWVGHGGTPLNAAEVDRPLRIVHIEDEPETVFAQIVAEGLYLGMFLRLIEVSPKRVLFWAGGDEHILAPIVAANISVRAAEVDETVLEGYPLVDLQPGGQAQIVGITPTIRGLERRRLLDLGILPGTVIIAEYESPQRDPTAYRVRDSLIALRDEQAQSIIVKSLEAV
jgi:DtxR family Mn-dependent transcriptional regulator